MKLFKKTKKGHKLATEFECLVEAFKNVPNVKSERFSDGSARWVDVQLFIRGESPEESEVYHIEVDFDDETEEIRGISLYHAPLKVDDIKMKKLV